MLISGIFISWIRYHSRETAIKYVTSKGGSVLFSISKNPILRLFEVSEPRSVYFEKLNGRNINLTKLYGLNGLERALIFNAREIDGALEPLSKLPKIKELVLAGSDVTAHGLRHFTDHQKMELVHLSGAVDEEMMQILASMPKLELLILSRARFQPDDLHHFNRHWKLKSLFITETSIGDEHLDLLLSLPGLTKIHCGTDQFSPAGLANLQTKLDVTRE